MNSDKIRRIDDHRVERKQKYGPDSRGKGIKPALKLFSEEISAGHEENSPERIVQVPGERNTAPRQKSRIHKKAVRNTAAKESQCNQKEYGSSMISMGAFPFIPLYIKIKWDIGREQSRNKP